MKPIYTPLLLVLGFVFLSLSPKASAQAQATADHTFSIHLGTFVKAQLADFDNVRPLGFIYAEKFQNSLLQVYLGEFPTEAAANELISQVKVKGYPDAYISRRSLQQGEKVHIIQLQTLASGSTVNWAEFAKAGPMYALLNGQQLTAATGVFDNVEEAQQRLSIVKQLGYTNASVVPVNNIYLHELSSFETRGDLSAPEVELVVEAPVIEAPATPAASTPEIVATETPTPQASTPVVNTSSPPAKENTPILVDFIPGSKKADPIPPPAEAIPESYDEVFASRSPVLPTEATPPKETAPQKMATPSIRGKVKRTSAIELQKVLKKEGTYTGSLDGYYGNGTSGGYTQIMATHPDVQKYKLLTQNQDQWQAKGALEKDQTDPLFAWEALRLLHTIAQELDPNPANSQSLLPTYKEVRTDLYGTKQALIKDEQKAIIAWNTSLWKGLDGWSEKDPVHKKMTTPLKITYYQSMVLLEDYFMDRQFKPLEAKGLSLSVLQTIVAPYLESYRN